MGDLVAAVSLFVGTNLDDLIVLTVLFQASRATGKPAPWQIWMGQYGGIGALVAASALGALGLVIIPDPWVGLLGIVPFGLGVRGLVRAIRTGTSAADPAPVATGILPVAAVTIANGADNIAVYTPAFRTIGLAGSVVTAVVFTVLTALWCAAGAWLGGHRRVTAVIGRYGRWLVPVVFMAVGAVIVVESGLLQRLR